MADGRPIRPVQDGGLRDEKTLGSHPGVLGAQFGRVPEIRGIIRKKDDKLTSFQAWHWCFAL